MKAIIISFLCVLALTAKVNFKAESHEDSPISVLTSGFFDPSVSGEAKIQAFLRLANELIPLAEVSAPASAPAAKKLGYLYTWCYGQLGDMFSFCANVNAGFYVGWMVSQSSISSATGAPLYNLTYTPFATLQGGVNVSVSSYPAQVAYGVYLQIVNIQIPTYLAIGSNAVCYSSMLNFQPGAVFTQVGTALLQCYWYVTPYQTSMCSTVTGPTFQQFFWPLWQGFVMQFVQPGCINFA
jgi:hypothetical protein